MTEPSPRNRQAPTTDPGVERHTAAPAGCRTRTDAPGRGRHRKALLEPAILLSLLAEDVHGYELIDQVQRLVGDEVCVDPGSTYRMLRSMEIDGLVVSTWIITEQGPNRRTYAITAAGRTALAAAIAELRRRARALETLADEAEHRLGPRTDYPTPADGGHEPQGAA